MAGAGRDIVGCIDAAHRQRAGRRPPASPRSPTTAPVPAVASIQVRAIDAHLDLLARCQRAGVAAAHRLRRHAGDEVPGGAGVGAQRRHRRNRARPLIVVEIQRIGRPAGCWRHPSLWP